MAPLRTPLYLALLALVLPKDGAVVEAWGENLLEIPKLIIDTFNELTDTQPMRSPQANCNVTRTTDEVQNLMASYGQFFEKVRNMEKLLKLTCPDTRNVRNWMKIHQATTDLDKMIMHLHQKLLGTVRGLETQRIGCPYVETRVLRVDITHGTTDQYDGLQVEMETETASGTQCSEINTFRKVVPAVRQNIEWSNGTCYCISDTTTPAPITEPTRVTTQTTEHSTSTASEKGSSATGSGQSLTETTSTSQEESTDSKETTLSSRTTVSGPETPSTSASEAESTVTSATTASKGESVSEESSVSSETTVSGPEKSTVTGPTTMSGPEESTIYGDTTSSEEVTSSGESSESSETTTSERTTSGSRESTVTGETTIWNNRKWGHNRLGRGHLRQRRNHRVR
ncbi:uncharacterized protein [Macrobrachium rosenbergii]|uniref:uncharacterized protein n=1 Tax=Macrobrachium rosenbergii TaxID=79674 RepID=UPI0034D60157